MTKFNRPRRGQLEIDPAMRRLMFPRSWRCLTSLTATSSSALSLLSERSGPRQKRQFPVSSSYSDRTASRPRIDSAELLKRLGPEAKQAVPKFTEMLDDHDPDIRIAAQAALANLGVRRTEMIQRLCDSLRDNDFSRTAIASILEDFGPDASPAIPTLVKLLQGDRSWAALEGAGRNRSERQDRDPGRSLNCSDDDMGAFRIDKRVGHDENWR